MKKDVKRTNNKVLPDRAELSIILETEVERDVPTDKKGIHYPLFDTAIKLFSHFGLPTEIFIDDSLDIYHVHTQGRILLDEVLARIFEKSVQTIEVDLFNRAYDYLAEEDNPQESDIIFVFGSKTPLRAEKAGELYTKGLGKKVMVSGGSPIYIQNASQSEAQLYEEILLKHGVPETSIIKESKAITVPDNVRRSLNLLNEMKVPYQSMILVNSPYTQRRGWAIFKKHLPDSIELYRVNSGTSEQYHRDNWYRQENTLRVVLNEFMKMRGSVVYNTAWLKINNFCDFWRTNFGIGVVAEIDGDPRKFIN